MTLLKYTYDEVADGVYIYFDEHRWLGRAASSRFIPIPFRGASMMMSLDASRRPIGLEILGVSRIFSEAAVEAIRKGRTPFEDLPPIGDKPDL